MISNLDFLCSNCAQAIVELASNNKKELENRITNALGVLQEDGVYSFYLFLKYRKMDQPTEPGSSQWPVWQKMAELLRNDEIGQPLSNEIDDRAVIELTNNLSNLLLAKQILERVLIFARYGLRSLPS